MSVAAPNPRYPHQRLWTAIPDAPHSNELVAVYFVGAGVDVDCDELPVVSGRDIGLHMPLVKRITATADIACSGDMLTFCARHLQ